MSKEYECDFCGKTAEELETDGWFEIDRIDLLKVVVDKEQHASKLKYFVCVEDFVNIYYKHVCSLECFIKLLEHKIREAKVQEEKRKKDAEKEKKDLMERIEN